MPRKGSSGVRRYLRHPQLTSAARLSALQLPPFPQQEPCYDLISQTRKSALEHIWGAATVLKDQAACTGDSKIPGLVKMFESSGFEMK
jgi:hypothetical protein